MIDLIKNLVQKHPRITSSELIGLIKKENEETTISQVAQGISKLKSFCDIKIDGWRNVNGKDEPLWIIQE